MRAIVSSPSNGIYTAVFYYVLVDTERRDYTKPVIELPCRDYQHARTVVDSFNEK